MTAIFLKGGELIDVRGLATDATLGRARQFFFREFVVCVWGRPRGHFGGARDKLRGVNHLARRLVTASENTTSLRVRK